MESLQKYLRNSFPTFYKFQLFVRTEEGKSKSVGTAFLEDGNIRYTIKLWSLVNEKFYLLPTEQDSRKFILMTRELNRSENPKTKYHWNVIGSAKANAAQDELEISFDIFERKIYLNMIPIETFNPKNVDLSKGAA
jgi:hypothetical protein